MIDRQKVRFLIDECVTLRLADMAVNRGFIHSAHVSRRKLIGSSDSELMAHILGDDWTLVTSNGDDFRTPAGSNSKRACYIGVEIHAGLICLNLPDEEDAATEVEFFQAALDYVCETVHLINKCVEVDKDLSSGPVPVVSMYDYPGED